MAAKLYEGAGGPPGGAPGAGPDGAAPAGDGDGSPKKKSDVIDAEFEESN
jgi:hypothetical protein